MDQGNLFSEQTRGIDIDLHGHGTLQYYPGWLNTKTALHYFHILFEEMPWQQPSVSVYGQQRIIPRQQSWFGDFDAHMSYSKAHFKPLQWHPLLSTIKEAIECFVSCQFNSVLVNHYRNGEDSVSWHADDEKELGSHPTIASLSLGCVREFRLKPKLRLSKNRRLDRFQLPLGMGDLMIMRGATQDYWHHAILKEPRVRDSRINLTFRHIKKPVAMCENNLGLRINS